LTAERLAKMVKTARPEYKLLAELDSVSAAVKWLKQNPHPQIAFFDIQLADGISFEVFEQVKIDFPAIFTTAFNEYAIKAFKVNSIDYLLKPIGEADLLLAIEKFERMQQPAAISSELISAITRQLSEPRYRKRFIVWVGEHIKTIDTDGIAMFHAMNKSTFIRTADNRDYGIEFTLELLENDIDPLMFFRVNRSTIISKKFITDIVVYSSSRLKVMLSIPTEEPIIVSRERVADFKQWLEL